MARPKGPPTAHLSVNLPPELVEWLHQTARRMANDLHMPFYVQDIVRIGLTEWRHDVFDPSDELNLECYREALEAYRERGEGHADREAE